jgi:hypothetical protein
MMIDLHSEDNKYACVYADERSADQYARSLSRDDPDQKWVVSKRKIRASGSTWTVYVVHAK